MGHGMLFYVDFAFFSYTKKGKKRKRGLVLHDLGHVNQDIHEIY